MLALCWCCSVSLLACVILLPCLFLFAVSLCVVLGSVVVVLGGWFVVGIRFAFFGLLVVSVCGFTWVFCVAGCFFVFVLSSAITGLLVVGLVGVDVAVDGWDDW